MFSIYGQYLNTGVDAQLGFCTGALEQVCLFEMLRTECSSMQGLMDAGFASLSMDGIGCNSIASFAAHSIGTITFSLGYPRSEETLSKIQAFVDQEQPNCPVAA